MSGRDVPDIYRLQCQAQHSGDCLLIFMELTHPLLTGPVYWVGNDQDIERDGKTYTAIGMSLSLPNERDGEVPETQVTIDNTDLGVSLISRTIRSNPRITGVVTLFCALGSDPDTNVIEPYEYELRNCRLTRGVASLRLQFEPILNEAFPGYYQRIQHFPGNF